MNMRATMKGFRTGLMAAVGFAALLSPMVTQAQDDENKASAPAKATPVITGHRWFVSPMLSGVLPDSARGLDDGYGANIAIGKMITDGFALELGGSSLMLDHTSGGGEATLYNVSVNALVFPSTRFPWIYGLLGAGYGMAQDLPGAVDEYNGLNVETGVGLLYPLNVFGGMILRADWRYRLDNPDTKRAGENAVFANEDAAFYDDVFSVGVLVPLGPEPVAPAEAVAVAGPLDSDNDGVIDPNDRCPGTPAGAQVDEFGCEKDTDGDGVVDRIDQCPDTPKGTAVNEVGCPLDSDKDGVHDGIDECPNTPAGAKVLPNGCTLVADCRAPRPGESVDANGCAEKSFTLRGVKFDFDSDRLTEDAKTILGGVADTLQAYPDVKVELEGHTCNIGTADYNLGLSDRRAASTKRFLVEKGIGADRMTTRGYGLTKPIDSNDSESGRENNRRVEMRVTSGDVPSGSQSSSAGAAENAAAAEAEAPVDGSPSP